MMKKIIEQLNKRKYKTFVMVERRKYHNFVISWLEPTIKNKPVIMDKQKMILYYIRKDSRKFWESLKDRINLINTVNNAKYCDIGDKLI